MEVLRYLQNTHKCIHKKSGGNPPTFTLRIEQQQ